MRPMPTMVLIGCLIAMSGCRPGNRTADDVWVTVKPSGAGYQVEMPGEPTTRVQKGTDRNGQTIVCDCYVTERLGYPVQFYTYSYPAPAALQESNWLDDVCLNVSKTKGGKPVYITKLDLDGHPGREVLIECNGDKGVFYDLCRFYSANDRFYCTGSAMNYKNQATDYYVLKFHNSFALIDR